MGKRARAPSQKAFLTQAMTLHGQFQQKKATIEVQVAEGSHKSRVETTPVMKEQETNGTVPSPANHGQRLYNDQALVLSGGS